MTAEKSIITFIRFYFRKCQKFTFYIKTIKDNKEVLSINVENIEILIKTFTYLWDNGKLERTRTDSDKTDYALITDTFVFGLTGLE